MRRVLRRLILASVALAMAAFPRAADAVHKDDPQTRNIHAIGESFEEGSFLTSLGANSDLAFWGKYAFQGHYRGFRILDVSAPGNPKEIAFAECNGNQGDVSVWGNVLVRSWNSPTPAGGSTCDGQFVPPGWEGVHVFDISNLEDPELVASVRLACGSHTNTLVPDLANNRVIVYSNVSSGCDWIDVIGIPLDNPAAAQLVNTKPLVGGSRGSNNGCHDMGVILGDVNLAVCASGHAANVFDIGANAIPGGSLTDPQFLYTIEEGTPPNHVGIGGRWHSGAFTWDGKVIVLGWEPGGGSAPECEATDHDVKKSLFFYDAATGAKLGQWTLPRPQSAAENCTLHNYNVLPTPKRYVLVHGSYQSGTSMVEFTDPANPTEIAYSDPAPLTPTQLGGAWSTYYYNNFIYESDITRGLRVYRVSDKAAAATMRLPFLNPQTQDFSLPSP